MEQATTKPAESYALIWYFVHPETCLSKVCAVCGKMPFWFLNGIRHGFRLLYTAKEEKVYSIFHSIISVIMTPASKYGGVCGAFPLHCFHRLFSHNVLFL